MRGRNLRQRAAPRRRVVLALALAVALAPGLFGAVWIIRGASEARLRPVPATGPYLLNGTGSPEPVQVMAATGLRWFTFAFVTASAKGECRAVWNEWEELSPGDIEHQRLAAIRAQHGDAVISFGGASGAKLTQACPTVGALYDQYRRVIELYRPTAIDIDIEGTELTGTGEHGRTVEALKRIRHDFDVSVSVTLPVFVNGLRGPALEFFDTAREHHLVVDNWTVMAFDYGQDRYDAGQGRFLSLVEASQRSLDAVADQVAHAYGSAPAEAYGRIGLSSMNGHTDHYATTGEVLTLADFGALRAYAEQRGLGRFTFWAVNRDRSCTDGRDITQAVSNQCSHLSQPDDAFATIAATYPR